MRRTNMASLSRVPRNSFVTVKNGTWPRERVAVRFALSVTASVSLSPELAVIEAVNEPSAFTATPLIEAPVVVSGTATVADPVAPMACAAPLMGAADRLSEDAELIATAVRNAEDRSRLDGQAGVDELTGVPNPQAFRERLQEERSRA